MARELTPTLALRLTLSDSPRPAFCLVVMRITPLAPRAPYKAPAEASLSTDMDSMSLLLIEFRSPSNGTPSTTSSGEFEALIDPKPRMRSSAPLPGCPPPEVDMTPATCPSSILVTSVTGRSLSFSAVTISAEPVNVSFLVVP